MFQASLCPLSGAQEYYTVVAACGILAASFHLPSVRTANINTVQYSKSYKQYEISTIPAVVISKLLLHQSNKIAGFVQSNSSLF